MSGVEIAGLFFGVLPVVIEAVKHYRAVCQTFHTFRHYSREAKKIQKRLRVCQQVFMNECRLLLQLVVDDKTTSAMLNDEEHGGVGKPSPRRPVESVP